jgi:hypothetical protein
MMGYDTVDAVVSSPDISKKGPPLVYAIADRSKAALIELGLNGKMAVRITDNGTFSRTRHHWGKKPPSTNEQTGKSNEAKLDSIDRLLSDHNRPFTPDDFLNISKHKGEGPEDDILKAGASATKPRTLATWIVLLPKSDSPELYVTFYERGEVQEEFGMKLDHPFWSEGIE